MSETGKILGEEGEVVFARQAGLEDQRSGALPWVKRDVEAGEQ